MSVLRRLKFAQANLPAQKLADFQPAQKLADFQPKVVPKAEPPMA
jgi:hypothetical protein